MVKSGGLWDGLAPTGDPPPRRAGSRHEARLSTYLGQYVHSIDDKGRVPLPAKFRNGDEGADFVLVRGPGPCLFLLGRDAWTQREERPRCR